MSGEIFFIRGFFDLATCRAVRGGMDAGVVEPAEVLDDDIEAQDDVRRAASIDVDARILDEVERRLDEARGRVGEFFALPLTGREGAGFLRYGPGGFYRPHRDRAIAGAWPGAAHRARHRCRLSERR